MDQHTHPWTIGYHPELHPLPVRIGPTKIPNQDAVIVSYRWWWWTADQITEFKTGVDYPEPKPKSKLNWTFWVLILSIATLLFLAGACVVKSYL